MTAAPLTAVGLVVKTELARRGLKAKYVAGRLGVRPPYLSAILRGKEALSLTVALGLEEILGLDAAELVRLDAERQLKARLKGLETHRLARRAHEAA